MTTFEEELLNKLDQIIMQLGILTTFSKPWWVFPNYTIESPCLCHLKGGTTWVVCPVHDTRTDITFGGEDNE